MSEARRPHRLARAARSRAGWARRLVVMVKAPDAGRVKNRLARDIGAVRAAQFYRHATAALLSQAGGDPRWRTILAVAPDTRMNEAFWPRHLERGGQGHGDLGKRLQRVMEGLPPGPVIIIGSDVPGVRAVHIARAFALLGRHDAVCGPSPDGGYWLIGLRRSPRRRRPFGSVRWSTPHARADTLANLAGASVAFADELSDIDHATDLAPWAGRSGRRIRVEPGPEQKEEDADMDRGEPDAGGQPPQSPPLTAEPTAGGEKMSDETAQPQHYSPALILQAGRRAEASGHLDYAIQFYRHLTEHHPETEEGKEARESLGRVTGKGRKLVPDSGRATLFPDISASLPARDLRPVSGGEALARLAYRGDNPPPSPRAVETLALPAPPRKNYGLGKFLARLLAGFGLFLIFAGIVFPAATLAGQRLGPFSIDVAGLPLAVLLAPLSIGIGIAMLVASQAAFAVFEQAEGLREMRRSERPRPGPGS